MRRIALYVSLIVLMACTSPVNHQVVDGDVSMTYLRSLADERSQRIKSDVWIEGCVVLNDKVGETYKSFVLYDGEAGVDVRVDVEDVDFVVPLYAQVRMRCEGLHVGREGSRVVLGAEPTEKYAVDRISEAEFENRLEIIHLYDKYSGCRTMQIADIGLDDVSCLVSVEAVRIASEESSLAWCDADASEYPFESSLRHFVSGVDTLTVATLNRCDYATQIVPGNIVTLIGVVDSYDGEVVLRLSNMCALPTIDEP